MELNSLRPYNFKKVDDTNYYFETETGLKYHAYFIEMPNFNNLYSFSFDKEEGIGVGARVKDTIISILGDFLDTEYNVLGYTCDTIDGKELARKRLFRYWFDTINDGTLQQIDFNAGNVYVSLIVNRSYWGITEIVKDIDQLFADIENAK